MVQNLDLFIRTFGKLSENYDHISIQNTKLGMSCHTPFTPNETKLKVIKCNTSLLETCHNFKTNKHDTHITTKAYNTNSKTFTCSWTMSDGEPVKNLVNLMTRNKKPDVG